MVRNLAVSGPVLKSVRGAEGIAKLARRPMSAYLTICAIFRDEAPYLEEWIEFHRLQGVEHLYLFDNRSDDSPRDVLAPYIEGGLVTLIGWPVATGQYQLSAYRSCLQQLLPGQDVRWCAFIDIDEFLFSPTGTPIARLLAEYEDAPGVVVRWRVYGSSGHQRQPPGLVIEEYTQRAPDDHVRNLRVKSIIDPSRAIAPKGPHFFRYKDDALAVDEDMQPVEVWNRDNLPEGADYPDPHARHFGSILSTKADRLRLNHYVTRSREEFEAKGARHREVGLAKKYDESFWELHDRNEVTDPLLSGHGAAVRAALEATRSRRRGSD